MAAAGTATKFLELGNFTAAQFDRAPWLGWLTVALLAPACAALLWSAVREWRGLAALKTADEVRVGLQSEDLKVARTQADNWLKAISAEPEVVSSVQSARDAETLRSLLRTGPLAKLDQEVSASGRAAALRVLAATAVSPWPGLDGVIVIWQSLRLVRHVARLYGLRPGALGTLRLLRRATTDASTVAAAEIAVAACNRDSLPSSLETEDNRSSRNICANGTSGRP
jgi:putative membrane protein